MLTVTRELIDGLRSRRPGSSSAWVINHARTTFVARHGGLEDAEALLDVFLEDPTDYTHSRVLDAVMRLGNLDTARRLTSACLVGGELKPDVRADVLHVLGFLGFTEVRDVLWRYAHELGGYYHQQAAALGLQDLPCDGLETEIGAAIRACAGKNLFAEFLPVLAHKVGDPELLPLLFGMGETASTDCNAGLVYGIALFGESGRAYFDRLLFNPDWEAFCSATGTLWWAYHGFRHLGGSLVVLARQLREWRATLPREQWEYRARVWLELAECSLGDTPPPIRGELGPREAAADIYAAAFDWSSDGADDSLFSGVYHAQDRKWIPYHLPHALRDRLSDQIRAEVFAQADPQRVRVMPSRVES
ncbi:MAG: hypothetical protein K2V38_07960 [Gemmataceae bacterium]|nr:hypothetical protein [Gemmataceae bacterium]